MKKDFIDHVHQSFSLLSKHCDLSIAKEINENDYYLIEYNFSKFVIEVEKYHREFYTTIYKTDKDRDGINLFNLVDYLTQQPLNKTISNYFSKENIEDSYRMQITYIIAVISDHYTLIKDFFEDGNYQSNFDVFDKYWREKHPHFYNQH
ncbi:hypothetical protein ACFQZS_01135 [Mucilaginibacter calamicampi]|uniref:Uncharacterized protein n=1 Tax=Mucilaginibacter calamicampi TaxID=1302352 RepID=A0ABW2YQR1_9SPHI